MQQTEGGIKDQRVHASFPYFFCLLCHPFQVLYQKATLWGNPSSSLISRLKKGNIGFSFIQFSLGMPLKNLNTNTHEKL